MGYSKEMLTDTIYLVRLGSEHVKYGDPYDMILIILKYDGHAYIKGAVGELTDVKELFGYLKSEGFTSVGWERRKNDRIKNVVYNL